MKHLVCPSCRAPVRILELSDDERDGVVGHEGGGCTEVYPVIDGIPRMIVGPERRQLCAQRAAWFSVGGRAERFAGWAVTAGRAARLSVVGRFDREWQAFSSVGTAEHARLFSDYFDLVPAEVIGPDRIALDAGCGGGRWAHEVQRHGARVIAIDLGLSIEVAARNTAASGRVACIQADVCRLPVRGGAVDLAYSLGVLHHVERTEDGLRELARITRPGGWSLVYLYYALEGRPPHYRALFRLIDGLRRATSLLPQSLLVAVTTLIAATVYLPLARIALALRTLGLGTVASALPLSFYATLSFRTMRNDSLDRFGTRLEKRFTRAEMTELLHRAGLSDVRLSSRAPYWHAAARRSATLTSGGPSGG